MITTAEILTRAKASAPTLLTTDTEKKTGR